MEVSLVIATGLICLFSFVVGAKVGQTVSKGEEIKTPEFKPLQAVRERKAKKEAEMEQDRINTIMRNIESYDGTGNGQEDVPR